MTQSGANSDNEASDLYVLREYPGKFNGKNNDVILAGRYGFLAGIAHARKSQAAEMAKMRKLLDEMAYFLTAYEEIIYVQQMLEDYAALKKEMG